MKKNNFAGKILEKNLQDTVLGWLDVAGYEVLSGHNIENTAGKGGCAMRMPLGAYPFRRGNQIAWGKHPLAGFPDIWGVLKNQPGRMFVIELKSTDGRFRPKQKQWLARLERAGVVCIVARDLYTVVQKLKEADQCALNLSLCSVCSLATESSQPFPSSSQEKCQEKKTSKKPSSSSSRRRFSQS